MSLCWCIWCHRKDYIWESKDVQPLISIQPAIQSFNDGVMQGMTTLYQTPIVLNLFLLYGISHSKVDTSATLTLQFSQARGSMVLEFA